MSIGRKSRGQVDKVRALIFERDGGQCVAAGVSSVSVGAV
jgi:hypothetical protein